MGLVEGCRNMLMEIFGTLQETAQTEPFSGPAGA